MATRTRDVFGLEQSRDDGKRDMFLSGLRSSVMTLTGEVAAANTSGVIGRDNFGGKRATHCKDCGDCLP